MHSELTKRIISGVIIAGIALFCLFYSALSFTILLLICAMILYAEWLALTEDDSLTINKFGGLVYILPPIFALIALRDMGGAMWVLPLLLIVAATDTAAYFGGKRFGKHKLAPSISPGKTWEGLACGMLGATLTVLACRYLPDAPTLALWYGAVLAIVAQIGDLCESWFKRRAGVKDSGTLIPGHGGLMDRVDGLIFTAPLYALLLLIGGNV